MPIYIAAVSLLLHLALIVAARQPMSASKKAGKACASRAVPRSILVVEDDPDVCELLGYVLSTEGLPVFITSNGPDALSQARSETPLVVILDLELPGVRGDVVAHELRAMYGASLPIVVVSAAIDAEAVADRIAALAYLPKPFQVRDLLAAVRVARRRAGAG